MSGAAAAGVRCGPGQSQEHRGRLPRTPAAFHLGFQLRRGRPPPVPAADKLLTAWRPPVSLGEIWTPGGYIAENKRPVERPELAVRGLRATCGRRATGRGVVGSEPSVSLARAGKLHACARSAIKALWLATDNPQLPLAAQHQCFHSSACAMYLEPTTHPASAVTTTAEMEFPCRDGVPKQSFQTNSCERLK